MRTTLPQIGSTRLAVIHWLLRIATAGALVGHGAYGALMQKAGWYAFFGQLGLDREAVGQYGLLYWVGGAEMVMGVAALICPIRLLLLCLVVWKVGTEFLWYPMAGQPAWEFMERWSNYAAPLGLLLIRGWPERWRSWLN
jgi:hypothetical protein